MLLCFVCRELSVQCEGCVFVWSTSSRGVVIRLMELTARIAVVPVREDVRGLLREWQYHDLPLKPVSQWKFAEQFGSYLSAGSEPVAQHFYVTARKAIRAVVCQTGRAISGRMELYMSVAPLHPMLICHGNRDRLADKIISIGGALSMRGMLSTKELEKLDPQNLKLSEVQKNCWQKEMQ